MNILIVDDDFLVSASLKTILETDEHIHIVGIGNNGLEAIKLYKEHLPDVLLMDIRMKELNGLEAAAQILACYSSAKILLLTTFSDDEYIVKALKIGAKGYLLKQDYESIIPAIKAVYMGQTVFGHEITSKIPNLLQKTKTFNYRAFSINEKEFQLIQLVAEGLSNKEISDKLYLGEGTVRNYLSLILEKLELRDRTQLAVFYYQHLGS